MVGTRTDRCRTLVRVRGRDEMTGKEFMNSVVSGRSDIIQTLLDILAETGSRYCLIGGLAVNAYVEPVVSLDVDIAVAFENLDSLCTAARKRDMRVERFECRSFSRQTSTAFPLSSGPRSATA